MQTHSSQSAFTAACSPSLPAITIAIIIIIISSSSSSKPSSVSRITRVFKQTTDASLVCLYIRPRTRRQHFRFRRSSSLTAYIMFRHGPSQPGRSRTCRLLGLTTTFISFCLHLQPPRYVIVTSFRLFLRHVISLSDSERRDTQISPSSAKN